MIKNLQQGKCSAKIAIHSIFILVQKSELADPENFIPIPEARPKKKIGQPDGNSGDPTRMANRGQS